MSTKPLDSLTALVMVANAESDDLICVSASVAYSRSGQNARYNRRHYCMRHLEDLAHRQRHKTDTVKHPPEIVCRMIARDDIVENVRKRVWSLFSVERPTDTNWHQCVHCRVEAKRKHRHG